MLLKGILKCFEFDNYPNLDLKNFNGFSKSFSTTVALMKCNKSSNLDATHNLLGLTPVIPTVALLGYCLLYNQDSNPEF